ncbi:SAM-dependent methyltransferase [Nocardioides sambongensis]|uniref:SAM-dependent methyltransferase n=1 Tax=Nocardioides sambongensis TaxID=2589074 RepID=UPI00112732CA|nr:SAM-dependent methyltransferase [Nocardioides sambongensis]
MSSTTYPLAEGLAVVREHLLDPGLVRAVASGRQRGRDAPRWRRVELRWVDLKAGTHLQAVAYDATQAHTSNHAAGEPAGAYVDELLAAGFGNWHVTTDLAVVQLRITKKGLAVVHIAAGTGASARAGAAAAEGNRGGPGANRSHDRAKRRLLPEDDPLFAALGLAGKDGRVKPSRQAKYRQIEEFVALLEAAIADATGSGQLRTPTEDDPLRIVDLGCGNGYLTFAAQRYLTERRGLPVRLTGVDVKDQSRRHNQAVATELGVDADFVVGSIEGAELPQPPDIVLALHACDTATDEALARAVGWRAPLVLAAPCCHHDIAAQLRRRPAPAPYAALVRDGILRERFADTLTDALRALLLRGHGYRVEVVEFVDSAHTPRNTLLRAVRTGVTDPAAPAEYDELVATWSLTPRLGALLGAAERSVRDT